MCEHKPGSGKIQSRSIWGWVLAAGAVLTFAAGVLGNMQSIIDFWKANVASSNPKVELKPFPEGAEPLRVPEDEPLPPSLNTPDSQQNGSISREEEVESGTIGVAQLAPLHLVSFFPASFGSGRTGPEKMGFIRAGLAQAPRPTVGTRSPVVVEAVQSARTGHLYDLWFDVFFRNDSDEEVLLVEAAYRSQLSIPHGDGTDSGSFPPNALYQIRYKAGKAGKAALTPPYRIAAHSRGAVRFRFYPDEPIDKLVGLNHEFAAWVIDSRGRSRKIIAF